MGPEWSQTRTLGKIAQAACFPCAPPLSEPDNININIKNLLFLSETVIRFAIMFKCDDVRADSLYEAPFDTSREILTLILLQAQRTEEMSKATRRGVRCRRTRLQITKSCRCSPGRETKEQINNVNKLSQNKITCVLNKINWSPGPATLESLIYMYKTKYFGKLGQEARDAVQGKQIGRWPDKRDGGVVVMTGTEKQWWIEGTSGSEVWRDMWTGRHVLHELLTIYCMGVTGPPPSLFVFIIKRSGVAECVRTGLIAGDAVLLPDQPP